MKALLPLLLTASLNAHAQTDLAMNEPGNRYIDQLITGKVDSIVVLSATYFRQRPQDVVCIFWKKDGQTNLYDERYGKTEVIPEEKAKPLWDYLAAYLDSLKEQELKPWSRIVMVNGKKKVETPYMMDADWQKCGIYLKGQTVKYTIVSSLVTRTTTRYPDGKKETNINYDYNMKAKRKLFLDMVGELVPE